MEVIIVIKCTIKVLCKIRHNNYIPHLVIYHWPTGKLDMQLLVVTMQQLHIHGITHAVLYNMCRLATLISEKGKPIMPTKKAVGQGSQFQVTRTSFLVPGNCCLAVQRNSRRLLIFIHGGKETQLNWRCFTCSIPGMPPSSAVSV